MKKSTAGLVLMLLLLVLIALSVRGPQPPEVAAADAPAERFSAARADAHLQAIAQKPHALGTPEHDRVREYIVDRVRALGAEPELQETTIAYARGGFVRFARVRNVLTRLEGESDGPAVLLMSHYDTVPTSPGAGDDSSGVAVMIEILRALGAGEALRNDVIFLFTDGEEAGLLGARAFVDEHPWASEVGVLLNFEARGTGGPSLMFETSPGNAPLIDVFDRVIADPASYSFSYEVYRRMPNDTDYTAFKPAQTPGYNFAFIHGGTAYHTAQDSLERLDLRSVQHHGDSALALVRELGRADLSVDFTTRDAVYFNLVGDVWIDYSSALALPLTILLAIAALALLVLGVRRGRMSAGGVAGALAASIVTAVVVGGLVFVLGGRFLGFYNYVLWNDWTSGSLTSLGLALIAAALTLLLLGAWRKKLRAESLFGGGLLVWLLITLAVSIATPGASYLFAVPLAGAVVAGALWLRERTDDSASDEAAVSVPLLVLLAVAAFLSVALWAPTFSLLGVALPQLAAPIMGVMLVLLATGPLAPVLAHASAAFSRRGFLVPMVFIAAGAALLGAVASASRFDESNRRMTSLMYYLDADAGNARWTTFAPSPDAWTSKFFTDNAQSEARLAVFGDGRPMLQDDAPLITLPGGRIEWAAESPPGESRTLEVRLTWPYDIARAIVLLRSASPIQSITSDGRRLVPTGNDGQGQEAHRHRAVFLAPRPEGISFTLELGGDSPLTVEAIAQRFELPAATLEGRQMPPDMMPGMGWYSSSTLVRNVATWTPGAADAAPEEAAEEIDAAP